MVDVESERVSTCKENIDPEIKFELVDEKRVFNVTLDHIFVPIQDILNVSSKKDSSSL